MRQQTNQIYNRTKNTSHTNGAKIDFFFFLSFYIKAVFVIVTADTEQTCLALVTCDH